MKKENIHDKLFKHTLSIPSEAKALVRLFLPDWIHKNIDYRTFKLNTQSYVNEELDEYLTDIIYDCHWKGESDIKISFLLEHKSYPDKLTPLQLLRYLTEGYTRLLMDKKKRDKATIIIPIVIYHDKAKWQKRTFSGLFELPDERLRSYVPNFDFELLNLPSIPDKYLFNLNSGFLLRSTLLVFKHKSDKDFVEQFSKEMFIFVNKHLNAQQREAYTKVLLIYIFQAFKFKHQEFKTFIKKIPKMTGVVPGSLYDRLVKEKIAKGIEKEMAEEMIEEMIGQMAKELIESVERREENIKKVMEKEIQVMEKGIKQGQFKTLVLAIRKMSSKKFTSIVIAELLEKPVEEIKKIQKQLKKEPKIVTALKKKQPIPEIAKKLKVSEWLIETIQELNKKKKEDKSSI